MPIRPELRKFYGYKWRKKIRPAILERAKHRCERCRKHGRLEVAHLKTHAPDPGHDLDTNLAALCVRCHKAQDYAVWAGRCRETRIAKKDQERPILALLMEVIA